MRRHLAVLAASVVLAGCGGGGGGGATATIHCYWAGDTCNAVTAVMSAAQRTNLQASCTGGGGAFDTGACPTAGAVAGHCVYAEAAVASYTGITLAGATMTEVYYTASWTATDARTFCESPPAGTWVP